MNTPIIIFKAYKPRLHVLPVLPSHFETQGKRGGGGGKKGEDLVSTIV